jgi:hypothetical protein
MSKLNVGLERTGQYSCTYGNDVVITSCAALPFMRTYVVESGRSPTWTIARPGLNLGLVFWISSISVLTCSRTDLFTTQPIFFRKRGGRNCAYLAIALPSILWATIDNEEA